MKGKNTKQEPIFKSPVELEAFKGMKTMRRHLRRKRPRRLANPERRPRHHQRSQKKLHKTTNPNLANFPVSVLFLNQEPSMAVRATKAEAFRQMKVDTTAIY